jgi:hypothetical protein
MPSKLACCAAQALKYFGLLGGRHRDTSAGGAFAGVMLDVLTAALNDGLLRMATMAADGIYDNYYAARSPGSARSPRSARPARSIRNIYINCIKRMSRMADFALANGPGWKFDAEALRLSNHTGVRAARVGVRP